MGGGRGPNDGDAEGSALNALPICQRTVARETEFTGTALHTGDRVSLRLLPAPPDHGLLFVRNDVSDSVAVPGRIDHVVGVTRGTTIRANGATVQTVEHVMAALAAFGVSNARIELTAGEPPVGDGSSAPFVALLEEAGVVEQPATVTPLAVVEPLYIESGATLMIALPHPGGLRISCTIAYETPSLTGQFLSLLITRESFVRELARARTFCLYDEIEPLMRAGLIQGGSLENAVVIRDSIILSKEGLRYPDEFVRHKVLDIVGDLALLGRPLHAHVIALKPGHGANVELARALAARLAGAPAAAGPAETVEAGGHEDHVRRAVAG